MEIIIFSDSSDTEKYFESIKKNRVFTLHYYPCAELKKQIKIIKRNAFIYFDVSRYDKKESDKILKYLSSIKEFKYGIIDINGLINDTALLFYDGASDYIGKKVFSKGITLTRLKKAVEFCPFRPTVKSKSSLTSINRCIPSGNNWRSIKSDKEYTFCMMYIKLDNKDELKEKLSDNQITLVLNAFRRYIEKNVAPIGGRIWMWNNFEGLILFPFNGKTCDAIVTCLRLMLSRNIFSVEESKSNILISYCIVLHIGNTIYRCKGNTGTIVSNAVNIMFHIGTKFSQPGNFYLTENIFRLVPEGLKNCFLPAGQFEDIDIMRMKLQL